MELFKNKPYVEDNHHNITLIDQLIGWIWRRLAAVRAAKEANTRHVFMYYRLSHNTIIIIFLFAENQFDPSYHTLQALWKAILAPYA